MIQHICQALGINEAEILKPATLEAKNARAMTAYAMRQQGKSYGQIAKALQMHSRSTAYQECKLAQDYYEKNTYDFKNKINQLIETTESPSTTKATAELVSVEQSPLSEPVIERNIDTILRPEPKKTTSPTDFLDELDALDDYQAFEAQQDQAQPDTIPEMSFKTAPNDAPDKVTIQMDEETANFSAESILNIVEFGSVEVAYAYASVPEGKIRLLEEEGKVPPHTTDVSKEFNENAREKLESTAKKNIKLLAEPLKKLLKKKNVSVSPESALIFGAIMFVFAMFMATKSLKKDADYFVEKLQKMNTEKMNTEK